MRVPRIIREPLLAAARSLGYEIHKLNREGALHGTILTGATYSPWNRDPEFQAVLAAIEAHTLVDAYRCYELWSLVDMLRHCEGALIEIGVWKGGTGALIAKRAALSGIEDAVYLCDTFTGVVKATNKDPAYLGGEHADTSPEVVGALLKRLGLANARILRGIFPDDTGASVADKRFRFCHVDVDVYQSARDVLDWIWDRLSIGGVIVYDDYGIATTAGVTRLVDEQQGLRDRVTIYNLNGHAVTIKTR